MDLLRFSSNDRSFDRRYFLSALGGTVFCLVFFLVYDRFSHGVRSPYMTYLFLWPLILEVLPAAVLLAVPSLPSPPALTAVLWHTGSAALTLSSALRGIFDIAGNASRYQGYLMRFGFVMLILSALSLFISLLLRHSSD